MEDPTRDESMYENPGTRGRIMFPGHRNRINCIDRHPRAPVHKRSRLRRGWEFAADKHGDGKFPIFVSRSRLTGPISNWWRPYRVPLQRRWIRPRSRWLARNISRAVCSPRRYFFRERGQARALKILLPELSPAQNRLVLLKIETN